MTSRPSDGLWWAFAVATAVATGADLRDHAWAKFFMYLGFFALITIVAPPNWMAKKRGAVDE